MSDETDPTRDATPPRRFNAGIAIVLLLIYLASPGPGRWIMNRLNLDFGTDLLVTGVLWFPIFCLMEQVKFIDQFYEWYFRLFRG